MLQIQMVLESQNLEPGAIYFEITMVLNEKNQVYHDTILMFLGLPSRSAVLMSILSDTQATIL